MVSISRRHILGSHRHNHDVHNGHYSYGESVIKTVIVILVAILMVCQKVTMDNAALTRTWSASIQYMSNANNNVTSDVTVNKESPVSKKVAQEGKMKNRCPPPRRVPNNPELDRQKYWQLKMDCQIYTAPIVSNEASTPLASSTVARMTDYTGGSQKEQYIIHIHGLRHTGTGYLRQTLHDALNMEFSVDKNDVNASPVASIQDSLRPYQHLFEEARKNKSQTNKLCEQYHVPEDEGHHLQSVYPRLFDRVNKWSAMKNAGKMAYLADLCTITNNDHASLQLDSDDRSHMNNKRIGNILLEQWFRYWDRSATFLLQKTPTLDVLFLERVKVLPTLHVIIVRHPMTSNSWG